MSVHRTGWALTHHTRQIALVIYPFTARAPYELSLILGAQMEIVEQNSGWFRGYDSTKPDEKGIFPATYVHVIDSTTVQQGEAKHIIPQGDQLPWELIGILTEWRDHLHTEYIKHIFSGSNRFKQSDDLIEVISNNMFELFSQRRKFIQGAYSTDELKEFKLKMTEKIDWTNWKLGLDLLPKTEEGNFIQVNTASSYQLFKTHLRINDNVSQRLRSRTGTISSSDNRVRSVLTPNHIYVVLKQYSCFVKEDSEILISLYNHQSCKFISEYYYSEMGKHGLGFQGSDMIPVKIAPMLFMDVGPLELLKDLYLIVRVVRRGRMLEKSGRQVSNVSFACRRPFGNGVLPLDNILKAKRTEQKSFLEDLERTYEIVIHLPTTKDNELLFSSMHEDLIRKHLKKEKDLNAPSLVPGVLNHTVRISLKSLEGDLSKLLETFPHLLTKEVAYVPKLGFPEVILPGLVRNHMYISLLRGEFEKGNKKSARNVEISVSVLDVNGSVIENAIQYGEGEDASNVCSSIIYYHSNTPRFDEIFRVNIPMLNNIFKHSHLRFVFRHVRSYEQAKNVKKDLDRPFAYGFLRLTNQDDTMIKDDQWTIFLYRVDDDKWNNALAYLHLPSYRGEPHKTNPYSKDQPNTKLSPNENFILQTMTVSTNLTQTVSVMSFLKWREKRKDLTELLKNLCLVSGQEIIKFMRDIFDNLFIILIEPETTENIQGLVFNAIVKILHLLTDKKYDQFKTVLDEYIESHFSASSVHKILLEDLSKKSSFQNVIEGQEYTAIETIWHTMSALEYLFKFIVQSQKLQIRIAPKKQYGHKLYIEKSLNSLHLMMSLAETPERPGIIKGQSEALKNFCSVFPVLLDVKDATKRDIAEWAANFVDSYVDRSTNISQNIIYEARLIFIENILTSSIQIMVDSDARNILLPVITRILSLHLMNQLCIKKTIDVIASLVHCLQSRTFPLNDRDISQTVLELLAPTMEFCNTVDHHAVAANLETAGTNLSNLLGLLDIMQAQHYEEWLKQFVNKLSSCFKLFLMLVKNEIYPRDWTFMYLTQNRVILKAIMYMSMQLTTNTRYFDELLWKDYFDLATRFITHRSLQLENYGEIKRLKFLKMYGDMRIVMARDVLMKWSMLGENQKFFIPFILHSFLEISLVKEINLRKMIIPVFYNIMKTMYNATDTLQTVEEEIMDRLDELVSEGRGDEEYTNVFNETLSELCNLEDDNDFSANSLSLVNKVTKLLERLVDFRNIQPGDEHRNQKLSCIVNLMNFYKEIDHLSVYIRYIHKLFDIHEAAQNYCEAANTLLLYSDMLEVSIL
ncbi:Dedicator of cytokinesis protein 3 isoform X2 [Oopsacas minuta]|uniref:Dedicator of cytokinesis protein 3 isoform X2 n=1 Tax=Oopsacas minuta TaxID=111878 RepID=A0AAV7JP04_9METZ|nr:Dedicator of cytokinesis protein 3 isoform X2 [Oopsacas minuta]